MGRMKQFYQQTLCMVVGVVSASHLAVADGVADLATDPGAVVTVTITLDIDTILGGGGIPIVTRPRRPAPPPRS